MMLPIVANVTVYVGGQLDSGCGQCYRVCRRAVRQRVWPMLPCMSEGSKTAGVVTLGAPDEGVPILAARHNVPLVKLDAGHYIVMTGQFLQQRSISVVENTYINSVLTSTPKQVSMGSGTMVVQLIQSLMLSY